MSSSASSLGRANLFACVCLAACAGGSGGGQPAASAGGGGGSAGAGAPGGARDPAMSPPSSPDPGAPPGSPTEPPPGPGGGGAGGMNGAVDAARSPSLDAGADRPPAAIGDAPPAPVSAPGCQKNDYPVCIDFEAKALDAKWRMAGSGQTVDTSNAAHGQYALHLANLMPGKSPFISTTQLGTITNVMWGRFYLLMMPGAPNGHGALVEVYDQAGNWYELGFQFSAYHGNWHPPAGVPERWMNSKVTIAPGKWTCVEFQLDGATPAVTKIWADGVEVKYSQSATAPAVVPVQQFRRAEIGFRPFHGTSLGKYEGVDPPALTDMWIDDIALDSKRIGCIN